MRSLIVALVLALTVISHAAPTPTRCYRACKLAKASCADPSSDVFRPRRCARVARIIARCDAGDRRCFPTTTTSAPATTAVPTSTSSTSTSTTTELPTTSSTTTSTSTTSTSTTSSSTTTLPIILTQTYLMTIVDSGDGCDLGGEPPSGTFEYVIHWQSYDPLRAVVGDGYTSCLHPPYGNITSWNGTSGLVEHVDCRTLSSSHQNYSGVVVDATTLPPIITELQSNTSIADLCVTGWTAKATLLSPPPQSPDCAGSPGAFVQHYLFYGGLAANDCGVQNPKLTVSAKLHVSDAEPNKQLVGTIAFDAPPDGLGGLVDLGGLATYPEWEMAGTSLSGHDVVVRLDGLPRERAACRSVSGAIEIQSTPGCVLRYQGTWGWLDN
jgi:hypothetical protein